MEKTSEQIRADEYRDLADAYVERADKFEEDSHGYIANMAEAAKYFAMADRVEGVR